MRSVIKYNNKINKKIKETNKKYNLIKKIHDDNCSKKLKKKNFKGGGGQYKLTDNNHENNDKLFDYIDKSYDDIKKKELK